MCMTGLCIYEHPKDGSCQLRFGRPIPSDAYCKVMDAEYEEHDPGKCGCEYRGNNMWSCGHIDHL